MQGAVFIRTAFIADDEKCLKKDTKNPRILFRDLALLIP
jgi:hypothetical protein